MAAVYIYGLRCPESGAIRYVGKTTCPLAERLKQHLSDKKASHKTYWLAKLKSAGKRPTIELLEVTTPEEWGDREQWWIATLRAEGNELTNATSGGEGCSRGQEYTEWLHFRIEPADRERVAKLRQRWGLKSTSAVVREVIHGAAARLKHAAAGQENSLAEGDRLTTV